MTEEEHAEPKTFYDNLTGKALKKEKVIEAKLDAAGHGRLGGSACG